MSSPQLPGAGPGQLQDQLMAGLWNWLPVIEQTAEIQSPKISLMKNSSR
jgi:hypothetical protein